MWSIGELARRAGVQASAIRYYESIGLLPEPRRVNGKRRYHPSALQWLELINAARACGFQIREIHTLLHGFPDAIPAATRWKQLADQKIGEIDCRIEQLQRMRSLLLEARRCNCVSLEQCAIVLNEATDPLDVNESGERVAHEISAAASD
jgi:MerR family transcriptional regulator, redox-sensitive transcriptional activator SoxR